MIQKCRADLPKRPEPEGSDFLICLLGWIAAIAGAFMAFGPIVSFFNHKYAGDVPPYVERWGVYEQPYDPTGPYWLSHPDDARLLLGCGLAITAIIVCVVIYFLIPHHRRVKAWHAKIDPILEADTKVLQETEFELITATGCTYEDEHSSATVSPVMVGGKVGVAITPTTFTEDHDAMRLVFLLGDADQNVIIVIMNLVDDEGCDNIEWKIGEKNTVKFPYAFRDEDGDINWGEYVEIQTVKEAVMAMA